MPAILSSHPHTYLLLIEVLWHSRVLPQSQPKLTQLGRWLCLTPPTAKHAPAQVCRCFHPCILAFLLACSVWPWDKKPSPIQNWFRAQCGLDWKLVPPSLWFQPAEQVCIFAEKVIVEIIKRLCWIPVCFALHKCRHDNSIRYRAATHQTTVVFFFSVNLLDLPWCSPCHLLLTGVRGAVSRAISSGCGCTSGNKQLRSPSAPSAHLARHVLYECRTQANFLNSQAGMKALSLPWWTGARVPPSTNCSHTVSPRLYPTSQW